jgi:hypothetical protein
VTNYVIEVLEGPNAGAVMTLEGRMLPYRAGAGGSISYGRTQRTKLTWYQGNRVASQQIIGSVLQPTTINGVWKERYLGEDVPIDLVELFEELLDSGVQLRVSWETIVREGIIKQFTWAPGDPTGGLTDIRWECVFEWRLAGNPPRRRPVGEGRGSLRNGCVRASDAIGDLLQLVDDFNKESERFVGLTKVAFQPAQDDLEDQLAVFETSMKSIDSSAARMGDEGNLPARLLEDTSSALEAAQTAAGETAEITAGIFPGSVIVADSMEDILLGAIDRYDILDAVFDALVALFDQRVRVEAITRPPQFTKVTPTVGGDFRTLAIQFYGNADLWTRIAQANGVDTSEIPDDLNEVIVPLSLPQAVDPGEGAFL